MEALSQSDELSFDREASFDEVFLSDESQEFLSWLSGLVGLEMLIAGKRGEAVPVPASSEAAQLLPRPDRGALPSQPVRYRDHEGNSSVGIPILHEGDSFAVMVVEDASLSEPDKSRKLKLAKKMIEWYIHLIHYRRMISELHQSAQKTSYEELLEEHQRVQESEKKYRELAKTLEQRVEARKRELELAQQQLLQQEKMASIGQLAAGVAHEINNPTGFVHSNLQAMEKYGKSVTEALKMSRDILAKAKTKQAQRFMEKWEHYDIDFILTDLPELVAQSLRGTKRIKKIVASLSRFSHVDRDESMEININELLDQTVDILWNEIKHKAKLEKDYGEVPLVRCEPNQLSQVFVNIIMNGLQAMYTPGTMTIGTRRDPQGVEIFINDTGKGISPEKVSEIFNPFFTTKPVGQGTGLGLSISYEIVKSHGGDIRVESEPWKGTTFFVQLPAKSKEE